MGSLPHTWTKGGRGFAHKRLTHNLIDSCFWCPPTQGSVSSRFPRSRIRRPAAHAARAWKWKLAIGHLVRERMVKPLHAALRAKQLWPFVEWLDSGSAMGFKVTPGLDTFCLRLDGGTVYAHWPMLVPGTADRESRHRLTVRDFSSGSSPTAARLPSLSYGGLVAVDTKERPPSSSNASPPTLLRIIVREVPHTPAERVATLMAVLGKEGGSSPILVPMGRCLSQVLGLAVLGLLGTAPPELPPFNFVQHIERAPEYDDDEDEAGTAMALGFGGMDDDGDW